MLSCRASRSSSTSRSRSSRRSPSSAPGGASGRASRASATARRDPRSWRFKFHGQTSGVDLTRQQPLNNIARVTAQAIAGIFGGLQSLHTDAYDEALSCPTQFGARIAVATQNILREEAHLTDVIDPLGGSYYVEALTDEMERKVLAIMAEVEAAGGMYRAVESGLVQRRIGESARRFQDRVDRGEQTVVGVNAYQVDESDERPTRAREARSRRNATRISRPSPPGRRNARLTTSHGRSRRLRAARRIGEANVFAQVVAAAEAGCTHGEICGTLRRELGFGRPLVVV